MAADEQVEEKFRVWIRARGASPRFKAYPLEGVLSSEEAKAEADLWPDSLWEVGIREVSDDSKWVFRKGCISSHIEKRYGLYLGRERFGGHGEHYGYPRYRCGIYFCFGHNAWFIGLSYEKKPDQEKKD